MWSLLGKPFLRHSANMAKSSKLRFLNTKEWRLDLERFSNRSVTKFVQHRNSFDFSQNSHFGRLHLWSDFFSNYLRFMTIGEDGDEHRLEHGKFCFSRQLTFQDDWMLQSSHYSTCFAWSNIEFFILLPSLMNANPRCLNFSICFNNTPPTCREHFDRLSWKM